jgi:hypothetical protein
MNHDWWNGAERSDVRFNRSFPIMPLTPAFTRLEQDPRPVVEDLKKLNIIDSRMTYTVWRGLMRKWGIPRSSQAECKFLVAFTLWKVYCSSTAKINLALENEQWMNSESGKPFNLYKVEDMEKAVKPAFGFWLFPVEAFGPFLKCGSSALNTQWDRRTMTDLSSHHPELGLSILPYDHYQKPRGTHIP